MADRSPAPDPVAPPVGSRRARLDPAVADVRRAVRTALADVEAGRTVLVACSGGPDSTALAAGTCFAARSAGWRVAAAVVDHRLQPGSDAVAAQTAARLDALGVAAVTVVAVDAIDAATGAARVGTEAAARAARYDALDAVRRDTGADCVLLGHTRDDQAETVLLGLARGSGARSLAGMAPEVGAYRRPLLALPRSTTVRACRAEGIDVWQDPHNRDPAYARARVRERVLPVLEAELGPGVGEALARTGRLLRDDADALDAFADAAHAACLVDDPGVQGGPGGLDVAPLVALLPAVRRRVLRRAALDAGCPATDLTALHLDEVDALVTRWHGQHGVQLPGRVCAQRAGGVLRLARDAVGG